MPKPQDPNLYGQPPPKKQKKAAIDLSGSLAFTSQLNSLLSTTTASPSSSSSAAPSTTTGRARPSKSKTDDLFKSVKIKRKHPHDDSSQKLSLKSPTTTEEEKSQLALARQKMESKARLYAAMKRGDYVGREYGLVDFDRKWAESSSSHPRSPSPSSSSSEEKEEEKIEYTDEFSRTRLLTRSQIAAIERAKASEADLVKMAAKPLSAPADLIYGDAVQTEAFTVNDTMEELARKRDRSATPPPAVHYDANWEIRTKGVGFYKFSQDDETRQKEMKALEEERERTEKLRQEREEEKEKRKQEIERRKKEIEMRRKEMAEKRAEKLADNFLEGLGREIRGGQ
ncbi:hypothetical protein QBC35DRAFT_488828 [Podospora australis]|uniref:Uncharacterized protein n=1 Tax=Podospora australis TaxID=1536484 RepID=A0AAN6X0R1_9PEZI|nr:hypothetical protein QBC35DRAFT_488828 [Podospora australis]